MITLHYISTLFVSIDVSSKSNVVYSIHIANFLSSCKLLMSYKPYVYCLNPKMTANYRKTFVDMDKTDAKDAYLIADFARVGRTKKCEPWHGSQYLASKRLTRHRLYLGEASNSVRRHVPEYAAFYAKKYAEVTKHQHKRALALTSRKFV